MAIKNILVIQPIFAPSKEQAYRNINSIYAMGEYLKEHGTDGITINVIYGGWAMNDELWEMVVKAGVDSFGEAFKNSVKRFDKNYGKASVVNYLYKNSIQTNPGVQAIFTMDSDIIVPKNLEHMFTRLSIAAEKSVELKKRPWGLIGLQQLEHGCHFKSCWENQAEYNLSIKDKTYTEKIVWPSIPSGIAGGCLFINREYWDKVGGYDQNRAKIYGPDDAFLLSYCGQLGYTWQVTDTIGIIHPFDNDAEYQTWKVQTCQHTAQHPEERYEDHLENAEKFWKDRVK